MNCSPAGTSSFGAAENQNAGYLVHGMIPHPLNVANPILADLTKKLNIFPQTLNGQMALKKAYKIQHILKVNHPLPVVL